jgi:hypothetical protein
LIQKTQTLFMPPAAKGSVEEWDGPAERFGEASTVAAIADDIPLSPGGEGNQIVF